MAACANPDEIQTNVCWIPISKLGEIELLPKVQSKLQRVLENPKAFLNLYWGDIL
jgi:hypothetical protein